MNVRPMRPDTVNRIRPCTYIRHDGKVRFVTRVQLAPTKAHPERIRLFLSDLSGCLASKPEAIHLLAGDIVWQTWDPRLAGPTRDDLAETDPDDQTIHGLHIGDTVHVICGRTNRRIEDISLAAREVKVDGYWVSADRIEPAKDTTQLAPAEVEREEYCGEPVEPLCGPDMGKPWCHYHNGTTVNPYASTYAA